MTGVNTLSSNAKSIKVGDYGSTINIKLENIENESINEIEHIRLIDIDDTEKESYIDVPEYTISDSELKIQLPHINSGQYSVEIKDSEGRIYPAEGSLRLSLVGSTYDAKETVYVKYKDEIISELPDIVESHMKANIDQYKGKEGDQGETGKTVPPKVYTREEYDNLPEYDDNTLYFIQEV